MELALTERSRFAIDQNGLSRCVRGQLVYEPDAARTEGFRFPPRLAQSGLRSVVAAPLLSESSVFGVLIAARRQPNSFSSGDCEFLRQLSEHVALAARQAQTHTALQQAYDDLRRTQQAVMEQERLRALGQMASGIAHDINNALSPVALYTESLLEQRAESQRPHARISGNHSARDRGCSRTQWARMREFYRQPEPQLSLRTVDINLLVRQVLELTRARWSDMPQQQGIVIRTANGSGIEFAAVAGIESEIREAFMNLIFNAVDAMPIGGTLTLRTRATDGVLHILVCSAFISRSRIQA